MAAATDSRAVPMYSKFVTFDIETTRHFSKAWMENDADTSGPPIACVGAVTSDGRERVWVAASDAVCLSVSDARSIVRYLKRKAQSGYVVVTWGGTATDWRLLAEACSHPLYTEECKELALRAVDVPFLSLCATGYMFSLESAALANGLPNKSIASDTIPSLWECDRAAVVAHVMNDALMTACVYSACLQRAQDGRALMTWVTSRRGRRSVLLPTQTDADGTLALACIQDALSLPMPDVPFTPLTTRETCTAWIASH